MMLIYPRWGEAMDCAKNGKFGKRGASKGQHCATVASGHLAAVERMVEQERYCVDILKQISAVHASLSKVAHALSDAHMRHCVRKAIAAGKGEEKVEELLETLKHLKHF